MAHIMDAHSHYMPSEVGQHTAFFKAGWSDIDRHLSVMDENGIEKALLLYPTSDAHLNMGGWTKVCDIYNAQIAKVVLIHPQRFIGAGILPIDAPGQFLNELRRIEDLGLSAVSLASSFDGQYLDDKMFYPVYEFAQNKNMPIHVHPQIMNPIGEDRVRDPLLSPVLEYVFDVSMTIGKLMMSGVLLKFPGVKFIFAHYGGVLPLVKERFDNTYAMLRKRNLVKDLGQAPSSYFKNLYFDTSGSKSVASLLCMLEVTDASHILFGSDFPAAQNMSQALDGVRNSSIPEVNKQSILESNLLNLLELQKI